MGKEFLFSFSFFILSASLCSFGKSKEIDSLLNLTTHTSNDSIKSNYYNRLSALCSVSDPVNSIEYALNAIECAKKCDYDKGKANGHLNAGNYYFRNSKYDSAYSHYILSLEYSKKAHDIILQIQIEMNLGSILVAQGESTSNLNFFYRAKDQYLKALDYALTVNDSANIAKSYNNIAITFDEIAIIDSNLTFLDSAVAYYLKAYQIKYCQKDLSGSARTLMNIGVALSDKFNLTNQKAYLIEAIVFCKQSINLYDKTKDYNGLSEGYSNLGTFYTNFKDFSKAIEYANLALSIADSLPENLSFKIQNYLVLASSYDSLRDFYNAYLNLQKYILFQNQYMSSESNAKIIELQERYNVIEKDLLLERSIKKQTSLRIKYILSTILAIVVFLFLIYGYKKYLIIQKEKKIVQKLNHERRLFQEVVIHETKRQFNEIQKSAMNLSQSKFNNRAIIRLQAKIKAYTAIYERLFEVDDGYIIELSQIIGEIIENNNSDEFKSLKYEINGDLELNYKQTSYLLRLINELVANSLEHAFGSTKDPIIRITVKEIANNVTIEYQDNGIGIPNIIGSSENRKGFNIINSLAKNLNGRIELDKNDSGKFYKVIFKREK